MIEDSELFELPEISVEWKFKKFFELPKQIGYFLKSPSFIVSKAKWHLTLYPNGIVLNWGNPRSLSLYLENEESVTERRVVFRAEIRNADGFAIKASEHECAFSLNKTTFGWNDFFRRSVLWNCRNEVAPDDILTLFCNIRVLNKLLVSPTAGSTTQTQSSLVVTAEVASQTPPPSSDDVPNLSKDLKDMYLNKRFTDITIKVKGKEFFAHRNILAARSAVISPKFQEETVKNVNGKIQIADCDPETFEDFLHFLYTGKFDDMSSIKAASLYETSDKYAVQALKEECVRCMTHKLTVDSFCDVLRVASVYNESELLNVTTDFFNNNIKNILMTPKWQAFIPENPSLVNKLLLKFVNAEE